MKFSDNLNYFVIIVLLPVLACCSNQNETIGIINGVSKLIFNESFVYPVNDKILSINERFNTSERIVGIKLIDESGTGFTSEILDGGIYNKFVVFQINSTKEDQDLKIRIEMYNADMNLINHGIALRNSYWSILLVMIFIGANYI